jgi:superfamily II DNA helicase RecQ
LLNAVARGLAAEPVKRLPQLPSKDGTGGFDAAQHELHERLKSWRKDEAARLGFDAAYLLNRHVLLHLTQQKPRTPEELRAIEGLHVWQAERHGDAILAVIRRFEDDLAAGRIELGPKRRFR